MQTILETSVSWKTRATKSLQDGYWFFHFPSNLAITWVSVKFMQQSLYHSRLENFLPEATGSFADINKPLYVTEQPYADDTKVLWLVALQKVLNYFCKMHKRSMFALKVVFEFYRTFFKCKVTFTGKNTKGLSNYFSWLILND